MEIHAAVQRHCFQTFDWLDGSQQYGATDPFFFRYNIAAEVHAVREVHVKMTTSLKHDFISSCLLSIGVTRRILLAEIGFYFDNLPDENFVVEFLYEKFPDKLFRYAQCRLKVEAS